MAEKYELIDGVAWTMAGATPLHNLLCGNIFANLFQQLRGSGYLPFNSDTRLRLDDGNSRFPDVAVYCRPELDDLGVQTFSHPRAVFELLSPSTSRDDRVHKPIE